MNQNNSEKQPPSDPVIDEVRSIRQAIGERFRDDLEQIGEYLRRIGEEYRTKTGRFAPRDEKKSH